MPAEPLEDAAGKEDTSALQFPKDGRRTALLLVLYGIERVVLEEFRRHPAIYIFGGLSEYQALAVLLLVIGLLIELLPWRGSTGGQARDQSVAEKRKKKTK